MADSENLFIREDNPAIAEKAIKVPMADTDNQFIRKENPVIAEKVTNGPMANTENLFIREENPAIADNATKVHMADTENLFIREENPAIAGNATRAHMADTENLFIREENPAIAHNATKAAMADTVNLFIRVEDPAIAEKYQYDLKKGGKWMMFFDKRYMNAMWEKAVKLYQEDKLTGILAVTTSTAAPYPGLKDRPHTGCVRFACGPYDDEDLVMDYGRKLVEEMNYFDLSGTMYYKMDEQSAGCSRATESYLNHIYRIRVSRVDHLKDRTGETQQAKKNEIPSRIFNAQWIVELDETIATDIVCDVTKIGEWILRYDTRIMDNMWEKACKLFRDRKLTGIIRLGASTRASNSSSGTIFFNCGPYTDEQLMKEYGQDLVQQMRYTSPLGQMNYKAEITYGQPRTFLYSIPVETHPNAGYSWRTGETRPTKKIEIPSLTFHSDWVFESTEKITTYNVCGVTKIGAWILKYDKRIMDNMWDKTCNLYREKKLTGIINLGANTGKSKIAVGVISFNCGPYDDEQLMKEYGRNLVQQMRYTRPIGQMNYKAETIRGQPRKVLYTLPFETHSGAENSWRL